MLARPEDEVLIFSLRLEQTTLSNTFPGFTVKGGFIVPLGELCRQLDLAVQVDPNRGLAEGFLIQEGRRFALNVLAGTVTVGGVARALDRSLIEVHADDIYVDTRLLAEWLPLELKVAPRSATITVLPREPLPLQLRWLRERGAGRLRPDLKPQTFERVDDPYKLYDVPFVDETLRLTGRSDSNGARPISAQSITFLSGDFLKLSTSLYAVLDAQEGLAEFHMTMGRRDPNAGLLGPFHATEFAFGEVLNPGLELLAQPFAGTGALVSNIPLQQANAFDRHSFLGDLAPGWQVELYRNQSLVGFRAYRPDGRYEFLNVPLYYGWNDFRLVFYGPQGQRREEVVRFDVSESQTPAGAFQYRLVGTKPGAAGRRSQFEARYGLSKQLALSAAVAGVDFDGTTHTYRSAGLQGFWKPLSASLTAAQDSAGGSVQELGIRSRVGTLSLTAKHAALQDGFVSEIFRPVYGLVRSRSSLETSTILPSLERSWFTVDLGGSRDLLVAGGSVDRLYNRIYTSYRGYYVSNEITRTTQRGGPVPVSATTTGDLLASTFFRDLSLRGQATYLVGAGPGFQTVALLAETPLYTPYLLRAGIERALATRDTRILLGANKSQGQYSLGLELSYSSRSHWVADLSFRVGLGREPRQQRIYAQAQGLATQGAVSARAFLDSNGNGVLDPGEKPLEGIGFLVNGARVPATTNAQGVAFLTNLPGEQDANLVVASASLEDPFMRAGAGVRLTPRPGHVARVDFPMVLLGEITGTVYLKQDGPAQELAGLRIVLADPQGLVVKAVRSSYDGFFNLTGIPPGSYFLLVTAGDASRFGARPSRPRPITISHDGTVLDGLDILLRAAPAKPTNPDSAQPLLKEAT